jgi:hypothetical protein
MFEAINLDGLSVDPKEYDNASEVLNAYAAYCRLKSVAVEMRLKGRIRYAEAQEKSMERLYQSLPAWARW